VKKGNLENSVKSDFHVAEMQRYEKRERGSKQIKESFLARVSQNRGATTMLTRGERGLIACQR
jgi:hypothetical protein